MFHTTSQFALIRCALALTVVVAVMEVTACLPAIPTVGKPCDVDGDCYDGEVCRTVCVERWRLESCPYAPHCDDGGTLIVDAGPDAGHADGGDVDDAGDGGSSFDGGDVDDGGDGDGGDGDGGDGDGGDNDGGPIGEDGGIIAPVGLDLMTKFTPQGGSALQAESPLGEKPALVWRGEDCEIPCGNSKMIITEWGDASNMIVPTTSTTATGIASEISYRFSPGSRTIHVESLEPLEFHQSALAAEVVFEVPMPTDPAIQTWPEIVVDLPQTNLNLAFQLRLDSPSEEYPQHSAVVAQLGDTEVSLGHAPPGWTHIFCAADSDDVTCTMNGHPVIAVTSVVTPTSVPLDSVSFAVGGAFDADVSSFHGRIHGVSFFSEDAVFNTRAEVLNEGRNRFARYVGLADDQDNAFALDHYDLNGGYIIHDFGDHRSIHRVSSGWPRSEITATDANPASQVRRLRIAGSKTNYITDGSFHGEPDDDPWSTAGYTGGGFTDGPVNRDARFIAKNPFSLPGTEQVLLQNLVGSGFLQLFVKVGAASQSVTVGLDHDAATGFGEMSLGSCELGQDGSAGCFLTLSLLNHRSEDFGNGWFRHIIEVSDLPAGTVVVVDLTNAGLLNGNPSSIWGLTLTAGTLVPPIDSYEERLVGIHRDNYSRLTITPPYAQPLTDFAVTGVVDGAGPDVGTFAVLNYKDAQYTVGVVGDGVAFVGNGYVVDTQTVPLPATALEALFEIDSVAQELSVSAVQSGSTVTKTEPFPLTAESLRSVFLAAEGQTELRLSSLTLQGPPGEYTPGGASLTLVDQASSEAAIDILGTVVGPVFSFVANDCNFNELPLCDSEGFEGEQPYLSEYRVPVPETSGVDKAVEFTNGPSYRTAPFAWQPDTEDLVVEMLVRFESTNDGLPAATTYLDLPGTGGLARVEFENGIFTYTTLSPTETYNSMNLDGGGWAHILCVTTPVAPQACIVNGSLRGGPPVAGFDTYVFDGGARPTVGGRYVDTLGVSGAIAFARAYTGDFFSTRVSAREWIADAALSRFYELLGIKTSGLTSVFRRMSTASVNVAQEDGITVAQVAPYWLRRVPTDNIGPGLVIEDRSVNEVLAVFACNGSEPNPVTDVPVDGALGYVLDFSAAGDSCEFSVGALTTAATISFWFRHITGGSLDDLLVVVNGNTIGNVDLETPGPNVDSGYLHGWHRAKFTVDVPFGEFSLLAATGQTGEVEISGVTVEAGENATSYVAPGEIRARDELALTLYGTSPGRDRNTEIDFSSSCATPPSSPILAEFSSRVSTAHSFSPTLNPKWAMSLTTPPQLTNFKKSLGPLNVTYALDSLTALKWTTTDTEITFHESNTVATGQSFEMPNDLWNAPTTLTFITESSAGGCMDLYKFDVAE